MPIVGETIPISLIEGGSPPFASMSEIAWFRQLMCVVPDMDDIEPKIL
jgi:hypothetical protein